MVTYAPSQEGSFSNFWLPEGLACENSNPLPSLYYKMCFLVIGRKQEERVKKIASEKPVTDVWLPFVAMLLRTYQLLPD